MHTTHPTHRQRALATRAALVLLAGALATGAAACGSRAGSGTLGPSEEPSGQSGLGGAASPEASGQQGTGQPAPGSSTGRQSPRPTQSSAKPSSSPSGPMIVVFRIKQTPKCPGGTTQYPVAGVPVILEWQVTGASQVTLSVDGPGVYNTYGSTASVTLAFPCGGAPGTTVTHTYTIRAGTASKTLSASAKVNEIPPV